jgi:putative transcriptional regulator
MGIRLLMSRGSPALGLRGLVLVTLLAITAGLAAQPPAAGKLLVASRTLNDPNFSRSVVLLVSYSENGALGLIVNRPVGVAPETVISDMEALADYDGVVFAGGPVGIDKLFVLLRTSEAPEQAERVFDDVFVSHSRAMLEALGATLPDQTRLRIYAGYAGWGPGQLDAEIRRGDWTVADASVEFVFSEDPDGIWSRLAPQQPPIIARLPQLPAAPGPAARAAWPAPGKSMPASGI